MASIRDLEALYRNAMACAEGESANEGTECPDPDTWLLARGWWHDPHPIILGGPSDVLAERLHRLLLYLGVLGIYVRWTPEENTSYHVSRDGLNLFLCNGITNKCIIERAAKHEESRLRGVIGIGANTFEKTLKAGGYMAGAIGIGQGVMARGVMAQTAVQNIGIGGQTLGWLETGHRNVAIGSLALLGAKSTSMSVAIGRDAGQCLTAGSNNVLVGYRACSGLAHLDPDEELRPEFDSNIEKMTVVGARALHDFSAASGSYHVTAVGAYAAHSLKRGRRCVFIGAHNATALESNISYSGKPWIIPDEPVEGTYVVGTDGLTVTVSMAGHEAVAAHHVLITFTSGGLSDATASTSKWYMVGAVPDTSSFTVLIPEGKAPAGGLPGASGTCSVSKFEVGEESTDEENTLPIAITSVGSGSLGAAQTALYSTVLGGAVGLSLNSSKRNVLIGARVNGNAITSDASVIIGESAGPTGLLDENNVFIGYRAGNACFSGNDLTEDEGQGEGNSNTALGFNAMRYRWSGMTDDEAAELEHSTAIGADSRVSGSYEIQLGTSEDTVYAFSAVQTRSDGRDKTAIRDTVLGLDFINALRPVDFKWDPRDDYMEVSTSTSYKMVEGTDLSGTEAQVAVETDTVTYGDPDGSKARTRYHHGLIAQEVKQAMDAMGIDFGGYQDHTINGGGDVLTIGYEELIGPLIKAVQQLSARVVALEAQIGGANA